MQTLWVVCVGLFFLCKFKWLEPRFWGSWEPLAAGASPLPTNPRRTAIPAPQGAYLAVAAAARYRTASAHALARAPKLAVNAAPEPDT